MVFVGLGLPHEGLISRCLAATTSQINLNELWLFLCTELSCALGFTRHRLEQPHSASLGLGPFQSIL